jgi:hypothetical protein
MLTLERSISSHSKSTTSNNFHLSRNNDHYLSNMENSNGIHNNGALVPIQDDDDVDTALSKLEKSLYIGDSSNNGTNGVKESQNGQHSPSSPSHNIDSDIIKEDTTSIELCEELMLMKNQKYTLKKFKAYYFILNDTHYLSYYKSKEESSGRPIDKINLRGCELTPDVNVANRKFGIVIKVPSAEGMTELMIR